MSSEKLKRDLKKLETKIYSEEETYQIVSEFNDKMEDYRIEAKRMFFESELEASKIFLN
jgi:hypothetical protein